MSLNSLNPTERVTDLHGLPPTAVVAETLPGEASVAVPAASPVRQRRWALGFALYEGISNLAFTRAIWMIYLALHGYNPLFIGVAEMLYHVTKFVAEVPTGLFADLVGRRASLVAALACAAVGDLLYLRADMPAAVIAAFCLGGLSMAFRGGAHDALLWGLTQRAGGADGMQGKHHPMLFTRMLSRLFLVMLAAEAIGMAAGGQLGQARPWLPFVVQVTVDLLAIPPLFLLPEIRPARHEVPHPIAHLRAGAGAVRRDPLLLGLLLISAIEASVFTTVNLYNQVFVASGLGFGIAGAGIVFAVASLTDAGVTALAPRIVARVPARRLLPMLVGGVALGLLAMATGDRGVALLGLIALFHASDVLFVPAMSTYLNARVPEAQRATILSLETGLFSGAMVVLFPLTGLGLTRLPTSVIFVAAAVVLLGGALAVLALVRRRSGEKP